MAVAEEPTREDELREEIIRAALYLVAARRPQDFLKAQIVLLQVAEELQILRA